jgi:hypothetical protein
MEGTPQNSILFKYHTAYHPSSLIYIVLKDKGLLPRFNDRIVVLKFFIEPHNYSMKTYTAIDVSTASRKYQSNVLIRRDWKIRQLALNFPSSR